MNFSTASNITLSDSISGYITADEDEDADTTQYLSVLNPDMSFEGMNITLSNEVDDNDKTQLAEVANADNDQPIIFTIDGSSEIFGVQVAHDEEGNLQKYQFQYREDMNGELVPLLETLQMIPSDDEVQESSIAECILTNETNSAEEGEDENELMQGEQIIFKTEHISNSAYDELDLQNSETGALTAYVNIKEEREDLLDENACNEFETANCITAEMDGNEEFELSHLNMEDNTVHDAFIQIENEEDAIIPAEHLEIVNTEEDECPITEEQNADENQFEQLFIQNNDEDTDQIEQNMNENDSDNEVYHIVDGIHITGDIDNGNILQHSESVQPVLKETLDHHTRSNILKKSLPQSILRDRLQQKVLYVQTLVEKENVDLMEIGRITKSNSRSLLKCNQPNQPEASVTDVSSSEPMEDKFSKRYSRTKEARQARQFMNFINSTTIPHVPERKERLPRKQQITPLKHPNEDIEVKEMIVSSSGFIEPISAEEKKFLPVLDYVELLDSGDENETNKIGRRKKKKSKCQEPIEIEIIDSDDSNAEVIESNASACSPNSKGSKKKRGRPPKNKYLESDKKDSDSNSESPPKMSRTESEVESVTHTLEIIQMENKTVDMTNLAMNDAVAISAHSVEVDQNIEQESISNVPNITTEEHPGNKQVQDFPMESNSERIADHITPALKVQNGLVSRLPGPKENGAIKKFEYKFECKNCKSKFINNFLLNRHDCKVKPLLPHSCDVCQKKFPNVTSLNVHKKVHSKVMPSAERGHTTNIPTFKLPLKRGESVVRTIFQPLEKAKTASTMSQPGVAAKKSTVPSKGTTASRPTLSVTNFGSTTKQSTLLSASVVKNSKSTTMPSASQFPRSSMASSSLIKINAQADVKTPDKFSKINVIKIDKKCDMCPLRFDNNTAWFNHQVLKHGLKTPDKNIGLEQPKRLAKTITQHNGLLATSAVAKTFMAIRKNLQQRQI